MDHLSFDPSLLEQMRKTPPERFLGIFDYPDTSDLQERRSIVAAGRLKRKLLKRRMALRSAAALMTHGTAAVSTGAASPTDR